MADARANNGDSVAPPRLQAREVYQVLKDLALGVRNLRENRPGRWHEVSTGAMRLEVDGYTITLFKDAGLLDYCAACEAIDGRRADVHCWSGAGTDPLELLSVWERMQLEKVLAA